MVRVSSPLSFRFALPLAFVASLVGGVGCGASTDDEGSSSSASSTGSNAASSFEDALDLEDAICEPGSGIDCSDTSLTMSFPEAENEVSKSGLSWNLLASISDPRADPGTMVANLRPSLSIAGGGAPGTGSMFTDLPGAIVGDATLRFWIAESEVDTITDLGADWIFDAAARAGCLENVEGVLRADLAAAKARFEGTTGKFRTYLERMMTIGKGVGQTQGALVAELANKVRTKPIKIKVQTDVYFPRAYVHAKVYDLAVDLLASYPAKCRYYRVGPVRRFVRNGVRRIIVNRMSRDVGIVSRLAHSAIDRALDPTELTQKAGIAVANASTLAPWKDLKAANGEPLLQVQFGIGVFDSGSHRVSESQLEIWLPTGTKPAVGPVKYHTVKSMAEAALSLYQSLKPLLD